MVGIINSNVKVYLGRPNGGSIIELNGLQTITESELVSNDDMNVDNWRNFRSDPLELRCSFKSNPKALYYFFTYGNDLYLRFPKKLRRKKRKGEPK